MFSVLTTLKVLIDRGEELREERIEPGKSRLITCSIHRQALHLYRSAVDALVPELKGEPESWASLEHGRGLPVRETCQGVLSSSLPVQEEWCGHSTVIDCTLAVTFFLLLLCIQWPRW